ncbi:MAG TPA: hypothetical protein PKD16_18250, partial [Saprospiraceae bacterium]|nr:hypothetical protein [Saprospiraceae bacterium]
MSENIAKYNVILELLTNTKGVDEAEKKVGGLQKTFNIAKGAFAGIFATAAIGQQLGQIFEVTKKYQSYNTILKVATGSQQEATRSLKLIEDTAAETVFSVDELTSSYIKFINRGIKPTKSEIINLADLAASQGKSFDQLTEAVLDASTGEFERLKEFGIQAKKAGDSVTLSFKGVNTVVKNTPESINKAIIAFGRLDGVAGSNIKQMKDLSGIISNIGDNTEKVYKNIGERLKGFFTESLGAVSKFVEKLVEFTEIPVSEKLQEEQYELNGLVQSLTDCNTSQEKRNSIIATLQEEYPFFLKNINAETASNEELTARLREVNTLYVKRIALKSQEELIDKALKASGEAQRKSLEIERARNKELNKIVKENELPIDLNAIDGIENRAKAVAASLDKLFTVTFSKRDGEPIVQGSLKAYNALERLNNQFFAANGAASRYASSLKEVEEQQNALKDFEKSLGTDLATIEKLFDVTPEPKKPTGGSGSGKEEDPAKAAKEAEEKRLKTSLEYANKNFALRIDEAKKTIKNEEDLTNILEQIYLEREIALKTIEQQYADDSGKYVEIGKEIDELSKKYNQLYVRTKTDPLDLLPSSELLKVKQNAAILRDELQKLYDEYNRTYGDENSQLLRIDISQRIKKIKEDIKKVGSPLLEKDIFKFGGFDAIDLSQLLPSDRVPALQNRLGSVTDAVEQVKAKL